MTWKGKEITHFNGRARKSVFVSGETAKQHRLYRLSINQMQDRCRPPFPLI